MQSWDGSERKRQRGSGQKVKGVNEAFGAECRFSYLEEEGEAKLLLPFFSIQQKGLLPEGWQWKEQSPLTNQPKLGTAVEDQGLVK